VTVWLTTYYDAIMICVARYREMAKDMPELLAFLDEFTRSVPLVKLSRWLGYVQGILIAAGSTTVAAERDTTRSLFRPLDFAKPSTQPATLEIGTLLEHLAKMNELAPLPWQADIDELGTPHAVWTGKFYTAAADARSTWTSYDTPDTRLVPIAQFIEAAVNAVPMLLSTLRLPRAATNESSLAVEARKLLDEWDRGELNRGEFETMMRELIKGA